MLEPQVVCVGAVGAPVRRGEASGAKIASADAVVRKPPALIELLTNASVAKSAVASPVVCVVALVPLGSVGVPLRLAAVPLVLTLSAKVSALLCAVAAAPAASNAVVGWNAAVPSVPPATVVSPSAEVMLEDSVAPVTPVPGTDAALVAAIVPVPVAARDAPDPTTMAAVVFVLLVNAENAITPVLVELMVTTPVPPVGEIVTLVPATILVTPLPSGAAQAAT